MERIMPTEEEMKILRNKISNMKDLFIFKNGEYREMITKFDKADYSSNKINLTSIVEKTKPNETKVLKYVIEEVKNINSRMNWLRLN